MCRLNEITQGSCQVTLPVNTGLQDNLKGNGGFMKLCKPGKSCNDGSLKEHTMSLPNAPQDGISVLCDIRVNNALVS